MPNAQSKAIGAALRATSRLQGGAIVYRRAGKQVSLTSCFGKTLFDVQDKNGIVTAWESADFLVAAENLVLNGVKFEPQRGDRIERTVESRQLEYEVMGPAAGHEAFRYSDPQRLVLRIHTKLISII